jgi:RNA polymerase-binding transcription factor DksA
MAATPTRPPRNSPFTSAVTKMTSEVPEQAGTSLDQTKARSRLLSELHRLNRLLEAMTDPEGGTSSTQKFSTIHQHPAHLATKTQYHEHAMSTAESIHYELHDVHAALGRLDDGTYGRCHPSRPTNPRAANSAHGIPEHQRAPQKCEKPNAEVSH